MPAQTGKSKLFAKLGGKMAQAHAAHKNDDPITDTGGALPAGIEGGIAQLVEAKFGEYKPGTQHAGQPFFYAAGVIIAPKEHGGIPVEGLRTAVTIPLCDTPERAKDKTFADHYAKMLNQIRILGVDTSAIGPDDLEATVAGLKEAAPHFRFRTWKGAKQTTGPYKDREPRVQEVWGGAVEFSSNGEAGAGVVDETAPSPAEEAAAGGDADADGALAELAAAADGGDEDAMAKLKEIAMGAGVEEEAIEGADNWEAVVAMMSGEGETAEEAAEEEAAEEEEETQPPEPSKGEVWTWFPLDPKTKKKVKKGIDVEIVASNKKAKLCDVKRADTKKLVKGVKWDALVSQ